MELADEVKPLIQTPFVLTAFRALADDKPDVAEQLLQMAAPSPPHNVGRTAPPVSVKCLVKVKGDAGFSEDFPVPRIPFFTSPQELLFVTRQ
jgi:hypothetical protein